VSLRIYDTGGQAVRTLDYRSMPGGASALTWDGCDNRGNTVPAGIYFIALESGQIRCRAKLVLLK
jgi:flagellar hook assembly protein FlgD